MVLRGVTVRTNGGQVFRVIGSPLGPKENMVHNQLDNFSGIFAHSPGLGPAAFAAVAVSGKNIRFEVLIPILGTLLV